ncbi:T9SS type A sorting domain-containing protein [Maribellus maritimus]|uniref:T9SS type A sorting domain-containing protein n=1 Tax=Maribellus maritimus TaxID=2870838 RepID=UPI001EEC78C9|nr:T9SS type A sorting domain-containing protein [Maribellus maritimus]MCG6186548.1 T9SS type A sorting domain-containing protein [Maribellus maritimus]
MKTKQFTLALLAVALTLSVAATKIPKMNIVALDDSKTLIAAETDPGVSSEILIEDQRGRMVYYKLSKASPEYKSVFDFSKLEDGTYTVKIKSGKVSATRVMEVNDGKVVVSAAIKTRIDPYFSCDDRILKVSYLNFDKNDISLLIYKGSQLVFQSGLGTEFNVQKGFNVSNLIRGDYHVVLAGTGEDFSYRLTR